MGVPVSAATTFVTDALASIPTARDGVGVMQVSNVAGSKLFSILLNSASRALFHIGKQRLNSSSSIAAIVYSVQFRSNCVRFYFAFDSMKTGAGMKAPNKNTNFALV